MEKIKRKNIDRQIAYFSSQVNRRKIVNGTLLMEVDVQKFENTWEVRKNLAA